jgi:phosphate transport system permease protein
MSTVLDQRRSTPAPLERAAGAGRSGLLAVFIAEARLANRRLYVLNLSVAVLGLVIGGAALLWNGADVLTAPALALLALGVAAPVVARRRAGDALDRSALAIALLSACAAVVALVLPVWLYGADVNGIVHRSAITGPLLLLLSAFGASHGLRGVLGDGPSARDFATYPVLALPVVLAVAAYGFILARVVVSGVGSFDVSLLTTAWTQQLVETSGAAKFTYTVGLLNNILGTLELIALTSLFAILPGVGAGVFMSEYPGLMAKVIDLSTTMLRAVSVFVIGATAFGVVGATSGLAAGTPISDLVRGVYTDVNGLVHPGTGSFITASAFLALLVIPIIAKLTEEGLRSIPRDLREGSVALGTSDAYGLRRLLLPWAGLNIITGLLIGAAEASGSLAVIMFIAGPGQDGVAPTNSVTSLDYALFATQYGLKPYIDTMADYRFATALLLLLLTLGLTSVAVVVRRRVARRYRGSLTAG